MNNRPTPETDAFAIKFKSVCGSKAWVPTDICRRFERERDEARKEVEFLKKTPLRQRCQELERLSDHWCDMHTVAAKERDEAREENKKLHDIIEIAISIGKCKVGFPDWGFICEEFYKLKEETK
jgi:hypothetical protein